MATKLTNILSYSERVNFHVIMLRRMFRKYPSSFDKHCPYKEVWGNECGICLEFIDVDDYPDCPCVILGKEEAKRRTLEKIENYVPFKRRRT